MKHRVAELQGALLDAAVAMAEGWEQQAVDGIDCWWSSDAKDNWWRSDIRNAADRVQWFRPSIDWGNAGPIIERERITIMHFEPGTTAGQQWEAYIGDVSPGRLDNDPEDGQGHTPLIAAMRAYVASKYGDIVDLPD
jgi:hypothetical protein